MSRRCFFEKKPSIQCVEFSRTNRRNSVSANSLILDHELSQPNDRTMQLRPPPQKVRRLFNTAVANESTAASEHHLFFFSAAEGAVAVVRFHGTFRNRRFRL